MQRMATKRLVLPALGWSSAFGGAFQPRRSRHGYPAALFPVRGPRYASTPSSSSTWLLATDPGLPGLEAAAKAYRSAPSPSSLEAASAIISTERHACTLNNRLSEMLTEEAARPASRLNTPASMKGAVSLLGRLSVIECDHARLGRSTAPMTMEGMSKRLALAAAEGGEDGVELRFEWELSRRHGEHEYSAQLYANGTRVLDASEVHCTLNDANIAAIQEHVCGDCDGLSPGDFRWLLASVVTFPSDDAFDVVSERLEEHCSG